MMEHMLLCGDARFPGSSKLESEPRACTLRFGRAIKERRIDCTKLSVFILCGNGVGGSSPAVNRA